MPGLEYVVPFIATVLVLAITPGPGMLYIAAQTVSRGRKAGWVSALGTHLASYIHIVATAFGLSLFLEAVPVAYLVLKVIGALYLFWLGIRFLTSFELPVDAEPSSAQPLLTKPLKESFIVELTNPKSAVFFIAFLPQFTDPSAAYPYWLQIVLLGIISNLLFSVGEVICVVFADQVAALLRTSQSAGRWMKRAAGSVLIGLGANLLVSQK